MSTIAMVVPDYTNKVLVTPNVADSIADVLLDQVKPVLPASTIAAATDISALNNVSAADVNAQCDIALADYDAPTKAEMDSVHAVTTADATTDAFIRDVVGRKTDTANTTVGTTSSLMRYIKGIIGLIAGLATPTNITAGVITTATNLTNAPTVGDLTATMKTSVNTEVDTAFNTAVPLTPTGNSLNDILSKLDGANTYDNTTDSLEAIRDKIDTLPTTTGGDATAAELAKVPKSDSTVSWNATALAAIKTQGNIVSLASATTTGVIVENGTSGTPNLVELTSSNSANTFGAWFEMDAAVSADSWLCSLGLTLSTGWATGETGIIEIGTGGIGLEAVKFRSSFKAATATDYRYITISLPIKIASGVRIVARVSDNQATSQAIWGSVQYCQSLEI